LPEELKGRYIITETEGNSIVEPVMTWGEKVVKPYRDVKQTYPEYMYQAKSEANPYSTVCKEYLKIKAKDSMYSYTPKRKTSQWFAQGKAVSVIMAAFQLPRYVVEGSLAGLLQFVGKVWRLKEAVTYYFSEDYDFLALRQGTVYDYIERKRDVSVKTECGNGRISMAWDWNGQYYKNPQWKITALAYPFTIPYPTILKQAQEIWENNMKMDGKWRWGDT
jgi:hypothetical protein